MASAMNDIEFDFTYVDTTEASFCHNSRYTGNHITVNKIVVEEPEKCSEGRTPKHCLIHNATHFLKNIETLILVPIVEKTEILRKHGHCYRCIDGKHLSKKVGPL